MYSVILNIAFKVTVITKSLFRIITVLHSFEKISVLTCLPIPGTIHKYPAQLCNFSVKFILQWSQGIKAIYIIFPFLVHSERPVYPRNPPQIILVQLYVQRIVKVA